MTDHGGALREFQSGLLRNQLACGAWPALASSGQASVEATCYSLLALGSSAFESVSRGQSFLLRSQNPNGSWPVFAGDDEDGSWLTAVAAIALRDVVPAIPARLRAFHWLLRFTGKESDWLWKWKFRTADRHVKFDPDKSGWPWFPDTISWVVPTAFALIALDQLPCTCGGLEQVPVRTQGGIQMLLDRACPSGGWNAGNGVVYGEPLSAHADDTAVALLALHAHPQSDVVARALAFLETSAATLDAPWSLAWTILALAAHGRSVAALQERLASFPSLTGWEDMSTLAVSCLALDHRRALAAFGMAI